MKLFKNLFKKKDWYVVWTDQGKWVITKSLYNIYFSGPEYNTTKYATYEILYSPSRNKYKLEAKGLTPKEHPKYKEAVETLNKYINKQNEKVKINIFGSGIYGNA